MQTLYSLDSMNHETAAGEPLSILKKNIELSRSLFTYLVSFLKEVALYAEKDAVQKAQKHLPTFNDLNINTKIAGNEQVWAIIENNSFKKAAEHFKINYLIDNELVKKCYQAMVSADEYKQYVSIQSRDKRSEKKILEYIFATLMIENENFLSDVEEKFINWDDDAEIMIVLMNAFLQKPSAFNFQEIISQEKADFATELLQCVTDKKDVCAGLIKPKLKNWDPERIASLDMILMQMGVCEFLYFDTIPPRVTINEYIDLAKEYSTEQSGHFVNGILDSIHKELLAQNKIHKKNYKNSTL